MNQFWGLPNFPCFHKTLKSISVRKSWNYCTSASSNHDLLLNHQLKKCNSFWTIMSEILSGLVNNLEFYKMSSIINIYSRRCTFSTITVTNNLPTFKTHLAQVTRPYSLQSLLFLKVKLLFHFCDEDYRFSHRFEA